MTCFSSWVFFQIDHKTMRTACFSKKQITDMPTSQNFAFSYTIILA